HGAGLGALLNDERRAALRASLRDGHVRSGEVAIRIPRTAIENARAATSAGAAAADEFAFLALRALNTQGDRPRVFALGVSRATDEFAEAAVLFHQAVAAKSALFVERLVRLVRHASALHQTPRGLAVGIAFAGQE